MVVYQSGIRAVPMNTFMKGGGIFDVISGLSGSLGNVIKPALGNIIQSGSRFLRNVVAPKAASFVSNQGSRFLDAGLNAGLNRLSGRSGSVPLKQFKNQFTESGRDFVSDIGNQGYKQAQQTTNQAYKDIYKQGVEELPRARKKAVRNLRKNKPSRPSRMMANYLNY